MEEILASIRRIISDDQSLMSREPGRTEGFVGAPAERTGSPGAPAVPAGGFDMVSSGPIAAPQFPNPDVPPDHSEDLSPDLEAWASEEAAASAGVALEPEPEPEFVRKPEPELVPEPMRRLAKEAVDARSAHMASAQGDDLPTRRPDDPAVARQLGNAGLFSESTNQSVASAFNMLAATRLADNSDELLAMVREMIRPLLKTWLDDNLPSLVERLVRAEIERVARGGR